MRQKKDKTKEEEEKKAEKEWRKANAAIDDLVKRAKQKKALVSDEIIQDGKRKVLYP